MSKSSKAISSYKLNRRNLEEMFSEKEKDKKNNYKEKWLTFKKLYRF